jgi:transglutaminase-like putative cysteine protease
MTGFRPSLRRKPASEPVLGQRPFDLLCLTMGFVLLVHAAHLPWWLTVALAVVLAARWRQRRSGGRKAPVWIKMPLIGLLLGAVIMQNGTLFGREPGSAFAVGLLVLKLLESEHRRDARVGIAFACFALMSTLLFDQGLVASIFVCLGIVPALATLRSLEEVEPQSTPWAREFTPVLLALLAAVPLSLFAFLFVPRLSTPLWGTPQNGQATTGLSNRLSPGDMIDLMTDDTPALRVTFAGAPPPNASRYFRAFTMQWFDGKAWMPGFRNANRPPAKAEYAGQVAYQLSLEPTHDRVVPMLDLPTVAPEDTVMRADHTVMARKRIDEVTAFAGLSATNYRLDTALDNAARTENLQLPPGVGPRARALASSWAQAYGNDHAAIARAALAMFHTNFSYTLAPAPLGRDRIDDFLFKTREGYCEHYASAFTFLMRAAGLPARVVTGYQGGYWNTTGNYLLVRRSEAHAWSEVWLEGPGWVRFDPTAAVRPERVQLGAAAANAGHGGDEGLLDLPWLRELRDRWDVVNQWWNRGVIGFDALRQQGLLQPFGIARAEVSDLAMIFALGCALLVAMALGWALFQRREGDALDASMRRLQRKLARAGVSRRPGEGPRHFLARAARALPGQRNALERLSELYLWLRYGHDEPPTESVTRFRREVKEFKARRVVK